MLNRTGLPTRCDRSNRSLRHVAMQREESEPPGRQHRGGHDLAVHAAPVSLARASRSCERHRTSRPILTAGGILFRLRLARVERARRALEVGSDLRRGHQANRARYSKA